MLAHAKDTNQGGSRIAIIMNGSPLFTGDAGSGESEIRRYVPENDLLEALIALPEQLFYNTGIATYVWVVTNRKIPGRREIPHDKERDTLKILTDFKDGDTRVVTKDGT
jgi:type I restriction enzyme M protein